MKKIAFLILALFLTNSCEKDYLIPNGQVPKWLKNSIEKEEQIIHDNPQYMNSYGAWLRFEWKNDYYFEYHNSLSSSIPQPVTQGGDTLHIYIHDNKQPYNIDKCCKILVWKAPKYDGS
jgi:hypothetical protein